MNRRDSPDSKYGRRRKLGISRYQLILYLYYSSHWLRTQLLLRPIEGYGGY